MLSLLEVEPTDECPGRSSWASYEWAATHEALGSSAQIAKKHRYDPLAQLAGSAWLPFNSAR